MGYKTKQLMINYLLIIQPDDIGEKDGSRSDQNYTINKICIRYVGKRQINGKI